MTQLTRNSTKDYRVIIAGSRDFDDYKLLEEKMDKLLVNIINQGLKIKIISGTARGADSLGELYGKNKGYEIERYPAKWNRDKFGNYNKRAGYERNVQMSLVAHSLVAFTNGSKGTAHMIDIMKRAGKPYRVISFK